MNRSLAVTILLSLSVSMTCPVGAAETPARNEIVCIQCHGAQAGRLGEPVNLWRGSVHAANGIACNDCHGGDPRDAVNAMSPARGFLGVPREVEIPAFCGRCHVGVEKDYMQSAHGTALGKGGPTCVTCHSNHMVLKASLEIINEKRCSSCHSYGQAKIIKEAMQQTEGRILSIAERIDLYKGEGVDTERLEKGLFSVRNSFHSLFHNVNVDMVRQESARFNSDLNGIDDELAKIAQVRKTRRFAGAAVVGVALLAALLFHFLRKSYD